MEVVDYEKKKLIMNIVDNPLFNDIMEEIRTELARMMLDTDDNKVRDSLHAQAKGLDKIVGHLTAIANEVRLVTNATA